MSVTEILVKVIDEVLDEKEREMILICLDYEASSFFNGWPSYNTKKMIFKKYHKRTTGHHIRTKIKSAMEKLEKSAKLRAINEFSA